MGWPSSLLRRGGPCLRTLPGRELPVPGSKEGRSGKRENADGGGDGHRWRAHFGGRVRTRAGSSYVVFCLHNLHSVTQQSSWRKVAHNFPCKSLLYIQSMVNTYKIFACRFKNNPWLLHHVWHSVLTKNAKKSRFYLKSLMLHKSKDTGQDLGFRLNWDEAVVQTERGGKSKSLCRNKAPALMWHGSVVCVAPGNDAFSVFLYSRLVFIFQLTLTKYTRGWHHPHTPFRPK